MARQSLRKRSYRYEERAQQEFDRYQRLLRRQEIRLHRGDYSDFLTHKEWEDISNWIVSVLIPLPHGYRAVINDTSALDKSRRAYFKICKILRVVGNRKLGQKPSVQVILRKHKSPESEIAKNDGPKAVCVG